MVQPELQSLLWSSECPSHILKWTKSDSVAVTASRLNMVLAEPSRTSVSVKLSWQIMSVLLPTCPDESKVKASSRVGEETTWVATGVA